MAYYRGDYYRGDYYRGDYYRGDPVFGAIAGLLAKPALKAVAKVAGPVAKATMSLFKKPVVAGAVGTVAGTVAAESISKPPSTVAPPSLSGISGPVDLPGYGRIPGTGVQVGTPGTWLPGGKPGLTYTGPGGMVPRGYHVNKAALKGKPFKRALVKNQRMNVTNPRALRRAIRRGRGFMKLARKIISFYSPKAPKGKMYFGKRRK